MSSLTPLFSERDIDIWADIFVEDAEEKHLKLLVQGGEFFAKDARDNGVYFNHTANLRSSIGYVVANRGDVLFENFELQEVGTDGKEGLEKAKRLAYELVSEFNEGMSLVLVVGEDYAVFVERIEGKEVMYSSCKKTETYMRKVIAEVKKRKGF